MPDENHTRPDSEPTNRHPAPKPPGAGFPVVGIGASAGGLVALQELLGALPVDTGMGFVIVQHLAPEHASSLAEILSRATTMPVREVVDEPAVEPDRVYVIPPGRDMVVEGGKLVLLPRQRHAGHRGIDRFFRSLAEDSAHLSIGVVLSGALNDGTAGLEEIKAAGGVTIAQDDSAQHDSMPRSAVDSGCVDYVLPPDGIARELARIAHHSYLSGGVQEEEAAGEGHGRIMEELRGATGVDFSHYKSSTLRRRITRRMMLHRQETPAGYEEHLRRSPDEVEALFQDILISVTSFFRDPEAFEVLARDVFPRLIAACPPEEPVRLWVAGCSSGEEAYSLAMIFTECAEAAGGGARLQLFATDVNPRCVEKARAGWYPRSISREVEPERLRRFFTEEGGGYRVRKSLRERCIFSRHNLLTDPPFSRVDFISCRNLLIYFETVLQQRVMPVFHYALKPQGVLWLGSSESVGTARSLFDAADLRHKTFTRRAGSGAVPAQRLPSRTAVNSSIDAPGRLPPGHGGLHRDAERLLLAKYSPPGVVVSAALDIVQFQGDTGPYLAPASGVASHQLLKMLREGLAGGVREALQRAEKQGGPVRAEGLRVRNHDGFLPLAVEVIPIASGADRCNGFIVLFDAEGPQGAGKGLRGRLASWWKRLRPAGGAERANGRDEEVLHLARELEATRESLRAVSEQHEAVAEELRSANEEAQSANEEMQTVNEELESSKEEMEASNEELATLNEELAQRNIELSRLGDELRAARDFSESIVAGVRVPLVVLDGALKVRSANPAFYRQFDVSPEETLGQAFRDLGNRPWDRSGLLALLAGVLSRGQAMENHEVRHDFGGIGPRVMLLNAVPLSRPDSGEPLLILSIEDVTERVLAAETRARLAAIVENSDDAIIGKDPDGNITTWNRGAERLFGYAAEEIVGKPGSLLIPDELLHEEAEIVSRLYSGQPVTHLETVRRGKDGNLRHVSLSTSPIIDQDGRIVGAAKIVRDITARKESEDALRESDARYRAIGESIDYGVWVCAPDGRNLYASESFLKLVGLTQEECSRVGWAGVLHPEDAERTLAAWRECVRTGGSWDMEQRFRGVDGKWHPVLARGVPVRNESGGIVSWVGINLDISKLKRAEKGLEESEERFRQLANAMSQLAWTARPDGHIFWYNQRWYEYTGTTPEAMEGWGWQSVHDPAVLPAVLERWQAAIATGAPFDMTFPLRSADGVFRTFLTRVVPLKNEAGEVVQWLGTNTDVDELKRAESALRASEEFKRSIIENSPDCIKVLDLEGNLLSLEAGHKLLGIADAGPLLGTSWLEFWERQEERAVARDLVAAAAAGREGSFIGFFRTRNGEDKWWDVAISPIADASGAPVRLLAVSRDVTERRKLEAMLVARAEALAKADRSKDEFLAMLAHELRNPLASLHHAAELLQARGAGDEERSRAQQVLVRQIENMRRMIDDLLDVSRITEGKIELRMEPVALDGIIRAATNLARAGFAARSQEVSIHFPAETIYVNADATRLEQVFGNLLANACKYGGEGCVIELSVAREDGAALVSVKDNGEGIAPELLPRVFELFVQSSRTLDRAHGGLGIGLTLVHRLVRLHGGSVEARSGGIGHGSEFIVRLPVADPPPELPARVVTAGPPRRSFRILIVDDNVDAAESLAMLQELRGHVTRVAHNGPAGLLAAEEFEPDVVLLDIGLPGMDGYEVVRRLRTMPRMAAAFVVAMTGYGSADDRRLAQEAGFDRHLVKPADLETLRGWLEELE